jgi:hypothetical protein
MATAKNFPVELVANRTSPAWGQKYYICSQLSDALLKQQAAPTHRLV